MLTLDEPGAMLTLVPGAMLTLAVSMPRSAAGRLPA
jgi:hypothetical protein